MVRLASLIRAGVSVRAPGRGRAPEQIVWTALYSLDLACFDTIVVIVPDITDNDVNDDSVLDLFKLNGSKTRVIIVSWSKTAKTSLRWLSYLSWFKMVSQFNHKKNVQNPKTIQSA